MFLSPFRFYPWWSFRVAKFLNDKDRDQVFWIQPIGSVPKRHSEDLIERIWWFSSLWHGPRGVILLIVARSHNSRFEAGSKQQCILFIDYPFWFLFHYDRMSSTHTFSGVHWDSEGRFRHFRRNRFPQSFSANRQCGGLCAKKSWAQSIESIAMERLPKTQIVIIPTFGLRTCISLAQLTAQFTMIYDAELWTSLSCLIIIDHSNKGTRSNEIRVSHKV